MKRQTTLQHHDPRPGMLPMAIVEGTAYFVDQRLEELREVENPAISIAFDSPRGCRLRRAAGIFECPDCGTLNVAGAPAGGATACQGCGQRLNSRRLLAQLRDAWEVINHE